MTADWYPGIRAFCAHWRDAPMLQHTLEALDREFEDNNDACIDASKSMVECACRVILESVDDPSMPMKPQKESPSLGDLLTAAVRALELSEVRDSAFQKLISQYHKLSKTIVLLRDKAGNLSHGKDGFIDKLSLHQRRAALLAADAIVTFLHEAYLEIDPDPTLSMEPYERYQKANDLIDQFVGCRLEADDEGGITAVFILPDRQELPLATNVSQLLFYTDKEAYKLALNACMEAVVDGLQEKEDG